MDYGVAASEAIQGSHPDYDAYHFLTACSYLAPRDRDVLVVGCNQGGECNRFLDHGARSVVGIDVMDEIGIKCISDRATFYKVSAEALPFEDRSFDFVYCFATMEHVPNIVPAYREMTRVLRSSGIVYCVAAPLWCTRGGPHWGDLFNDLPWPHLRLQEEEIIAEGVKRGLSRPQVEYFLSDHCNRRRAAEYLSACGALADIRTIRNDLEMEAQDDSFGVVAGLLARGYSEADLYGLTHTFIAQKA